MDAGQEFHLDIAGQQPGLSIHTHITLCFSMTNGASKDKIVETLKNGLERLSRSFPWLAGQVVNEGATEGNTGLYKIVPLDSVPRLVVRDRRGDKRVPTMDDFRRAVFPINTIDEKLVAPRKTIPTSEERASGFPVLILQATFIEGGLLLTFTGQHQAMGMTGQGQLISMLSRVCKDEPLTDEEVEVGNRDRRSFVALFEDKWQPGPGALRKMLDLSELPPPPHKRVWANISFSSKSLKKIKTLALDTLPSDDVGYVSTDDALTAYTWQAIMRARLHRLDPDVEVTLSRAVDVRRHLGVSETYTGLMQNMTFHPFTLKDLISAPLGVVAAHLRRAVDPSTSDLADATHAIVTALARAEDKTSVSFVAGLRLDRDIVFSSWAQVGCYREDFGLGLGMPESVRLPRQGGLESLVYLLPRREDGDITLVVYLSQEDMERLKEDADFMRFGRYIG